MLCYSLQIVTAGDTLYVAQYGIKPNTFENVNAKLQQVFKDCKEQKAKVVVFEKGRYDLWPEDAVKKDIFISNTASEKESPSKQKTLGMYLNELTDVTIEGNDATLMCHGKMTMVAVEHCKHITIQNLHLDFERPGGSEMTYLQVCENKAVVKIHRDARYAIIDGRMHLYGEGWRSNINHCIEYDPANKHFFYSRDWNRLAQMPVRELQPGLVEFTIPADFHPIVGHTLTIRDIIRDQVGVLLLESEDIELKRVQVHYMHGLGIVSQYCKNVTMTEVHCTPREDSGRILASSADFMHFSGCSGKVSVIGCQFAGAQDDPINVHGTNLRVVEKQDDYTLNLQFMHHQSYGYNAYHVGDTVAYVQPATMVRYATAQVTNVERLSDRQVKVTLNKVVPRTLRVNEDCLENLTCTPEVEVRRCHFTRTSTRGTLMTTPRKVVIADNIYLKTGMNAILISGDAKDWFESGPVNDVLITGNMFLDCAYSGGPHSACISISPSNTEVDSAIPVHRNIRIENNTFHTWGNTILYVKSTEGLTFINNTIQKTYDSPKATEEAFIFEGCSKVVLKGNKLMIPAPVKMIKMNKKNIKTDLKL